MINMKSPAKSWRIFFPAFLLIFSFYWNTGISHAQSEDSSSITDLVQFCSEQKGFNLLGKFDVSWSNAGYTEKEFLLIHNLGFNFVRLPLDYRTYTQAGNWNVFLEAEVKEIDNAVSWGKKYGVHVCINLHRAPGYCVNAATLPLNQQLNLWTDTVAQDAFIEHWEYFAERYKNFAPADLSFNLVNEPSNVTESAYLPLVRRAIQAIHAISPERIIFVDGLEYGRILLPALKDESFVAQAIHCYDPFGLTHYKAEWVNGADLWAEPHWPMQWISTYLYGPWKADYKSALIINGSFKLGAEVIVNVRQVSMESTLQVKADSKILLSKKFVCTADTGTDFSQVVNTEWGYQNISNKNFSTNLTSDATKLSFENTSGDWMTINHIILKQDTSELVIYLSDDSWGRKQASYTLGADGILRTPEGNDLLPFETYRANVAIAKENNIPMMVQEFGVYNKTAHEVTLSFLSDLTDFFYENKIGWALWNFSGSFGILDSDREDCAYTPYQGQLLDQPMLLVLTRHQTQIKKMGRNQVLLYPSPVNGEIYFNAGKLNGKTTVTIHDMAGRIVQSCLLQTNGPEVIKLDVSRLKSDIYLLKAENNGVYFTGKFLVK
jgi:aryl-phospho-beta-D-glucosidase BglC (GH1 family)